MSSSFTLVNLYAPNSGQVDFLDKVFGLPQYRAQPFMIIGGDFNLVMSSTRDRQTMLNDIPSRKSNSQASAFHKCVRSHQLFDSWRIKHPTAKQLTFFSTAHKMYSRLDHFLISAPLLPHIIDSNISPIMWSDHAPITMEVMLSKIPSRSCHWRLNDQLLHSEPSRVKLAAGLEEFFLFNVGSIPDFSTVWEAHKAVFRGACIVEGTRLKKDRNKLLESLTSDLTVAERKCRNFVWLHPSGNKLNLYNLVRQVNLYSGLNKNSMSLLTSPIGCW